MSRKTAERTPLFSILFVCSAVSIFCIVVFDRNANFLCVFLRVLLHRHLNIVAWLYPESPPRHVARLYPESPPRHKTCSSRRQVTHFVLRASSAGSDVFWLVPVKCPTDSTLQYQRLNKGTHISTLQCQRLNKGEHNSTLHYQRLNKGAHNNTTPHCTNRTNDVTVCTVSSAANRTNDMPVCTVNSAANWTHNRRMAHVYRG
jgi:hypothetical protein